MASTRDLTRGWTGPDTRSTDGQRDRVRPAQKHVFWASYFGWLGLGNSLSLTAIFFVIGLLLLPLAREGGGKLAPD